jgi:leucyl aminopeptidase
VDFSIKTIDAKSASTAYKAVKTACIVVGVFENKKLSAAAANLDKQGVIAAALKSGDISGKPFLIIAPQRCRNGSGTGVTCWSR